MKKALVIILVGFVVALGFYYWRLFLPRDSGQGTPLGQRALIDETQFTRADTLAALDSILAGSPVSFTLGSGTPASGTLAELPEITQRFVVPGPNEVVEVRKPATGAQYYFAHYFSEIALPESHARFNRLAHPNEFKRLYGFRNNLASLIDLESESHIIRITQLAVSEERTEVMVYIKSK